MWVLSGDDDEALRTRWATLLDAADHAGGVREDVDCSLDGGNALVAAVCSPAMFGPRRIVAAENISAITPTVIDQLVASGAHSDAAVIARCTGTFPAAMKKALAGVAEMVVCAMPRGKGVQIRVDEIAAKCNIKLTGETRRILMERAGHDLDRVRSAMVSCDLAGLTHPKPHQIQLLLGSSAAPGVSWAITDALGRGDTAGALRSTFDVSPFAVLGYLASQVESAGKIVDADCRDADSAAALLGKTAFQAQQALALARRLGRDGIKSAWRIIADAQSAARSSVGDKAALDICVVRLAPLWSSRR